MGAIVVMLIAKFTRPVDHKKKITRPKKMVMVQT